MKKELLLATVTGIVGAVIGFFIINLFVGSIEPFTITTLRPASDSSSSMEDYSSLAEPNPEIFNYKSINPTVEVYVGNGSSTIIVSGDMPVSDDTSTDTPEEGQ